MGPSIKPWMDRSDPLPALGLGYTYTTSKHSILTNSYNSSLTGQVNVGHVQIPHEGHAKSDAVVVPVLLPVHCPYGCPYTCVHGHSYVHHQKWSAGALSRIMSN